MTDCEFELDCANNGTVKCQICLRIAEISERREGHSHYPGYKCKRYYLKSLPFIEVKWLFEPWVECHHGVNVRSFDRVERAEA